MSRPHVWCEVHLENWLNAGDNPLCCCHALHPALMHTPMSHSSREIVSFFGTDMQQTLFCWLFGDRFVNYSAYNSRCHWPYSANNSKNGASRKLERFRAIEATHECIFVSLQEEGKWGGGPRGREGRRGHYPAQCLTVFVLQPRNSSGITSPTMHANNLR